MTTSCDVKLSVPFHDLDPLHVVWHGNYYKYFDIARFALFKKCGIDLYDYSQREKILFPITRSAAKHIIPLRHQDEFVCRATVTGARYKIALAFEIRRTNDDRLCSRGTSEQVAVMMPDMELQFEIPETIQRALGFK